MEVLPFDLWEFNKHYRWFDLTLCIYNDANDINVQLLTSTFA